MKNHPWLKAYLAGLSFGATIYPFLWLCLVWMGHPAAQSLLFYAIILFMPVVCGIWNVVYFAAFEKHPIRTRSYRLWGHGAILGLFMLVPTSSSLIGFEKLLFGPVNWWEYVHLPFVPVVWGYVWLYITGFFNDQLGLKDDL